MTCRTQGVPAGVGVGIKGCESGRKLTSLCGPLEPAKGCSRCSAPELGMRLGNWRRGGRDEELQLGSLLPRLVWPLVPQTLSFSWTILHASTVLCSVPPPFWANTVALPYLDDSLLNSWPPITFLCSPHHLRLHCRDVTWPVAPLLQVFPKSPVIFRKTLDAFRAACLHLGYLHPRPVQRPQFWPRLPLFWAFELHMESVCMLHPWWVNSEMCFRQERFSLSEIVNSAACLASCEQLNCWVYFAFLI